MSGVPTASGPAPAAATAPSATAAAAPATATASGKPSKKKATKAGGTSKKKSNANRRKKPASKASTAASNQQVWNDAAKAQIDLAQQRADAIARRTDPLWYRMEDVLPAVSKDSSLKMVGASTAAGGSLPEQVQIVESALSLNGLSRADVTPQAMACLLEQARRYAVEISQDATDYAYAAGRPELRPADVLLAVEMRADHPTSISTQLPKLTWLAEKVNRVPLPPIPSQCYSGVLLPPVQDQLTARTFDVCFGAQTAQKMVQKAPAAPAAASTKDSKQQQQQPGYGATRGRQIPIKLKEQQQQGTSQSQQDGAQTAMDTSK